MADIVALQERLAHLERSVQDLSDELARRGREIDRLTRLVDMLAAREAAREAEMGAPVDPVDEKPPHY